MPGGELEEWELRRLRAVVKVQAHWRGLLQRRKMAKSPERARREQVRAGAAGGGAGGGRPRLCVLGGWVGGVVGPASVAGKP